MTDFCSTPSQTTGVWCATALPKLKWADSVDQDIRLLGQSKWKGLLSNGEEWKKPGPIQGCQADDDDDDDNNVLHEWLDPNIFNILLIQSSISTTFFCLVIYMQDGTTVHTANYSINVLNEVSEESQITDVTCKVCSLISLRFSFLGNPKIQHVIKQFPQTS
jgi:hypothetical protein